MPIYCSLKIRDVTDEAFELIDEAVMRCAYVSQNHFGRLFDERIYENNIALRLRAEGFEVQTQVPITVVHDDFEKRYAPRFGKSGWRILTPQCERLIGRIKELLKDWGTHLESRLYNEALVHHFGGELHCLHRFQIVADEVNLGSHLVQLFARGYAFVTTSFSVAQPTYHEHLRKLVHHTGLNAIQWLNLNRSRLEITTVEREGRGM